MYKFMKAAALTAAMTVSASVATAASYTFQYTEGQRYQVQGSVALAPTDASPANPGFLLGTINAGQSMAVHGRIVTNIDTFTFTTTARSTKVEWILDGYFLEKDGSFESVSGYVPAVRDAPGSTIRVPAALGTPISVTGMTFDEDSDGVGLVSPVGSPFSSEISARVGSDPFIISLKAGTYTFKMDAETVPGANSPDALYDIKISAVPLPAGALLLLTGVAGLGIARRRRKA